MSKNISVIGVGRLGLCFCLVLEKAGYNILGCDINTYLVEKINDRSLTSDEPHVTDYLRASKNLRLTTDLSECIGYSDLLWILVDTPTGTNRNAYDHSKLGTVLNLLNKQKVSNKHIIIGCTVIPGYIDRCARLLLKDCANCTVSYNPEFIAQGDIIRGLLNPDIVLIGEGDAKAGEAIEEVYRKIGELQLPERVNPREPQIFRMGPSSAEICKLSVNCFVTTKIAFANMIGDIADRTPNANKHDILRAVGGDSRVGSKCIQPGYGYGGLCFPRDNRALGNYAESIGIEPFVSRATDSSNKFHAKEMARVLIEKNLDKYVFEDVCFKENCKVVMIEESQKLYVAFLVSQEKKRVIIRDREAVITAVKIEYGDNFEYEII